jgi:hypothetical protein
MSCENPVSINAPPFAVQSSISEKPCRPFKAWTAIAGKRRNSAGRNSSNPAGNLQLAAQGFHRPRVAPAFRFGPHAVFNMDAAKGKTRFYAQLRQSRQHGSRIRAS